MRAALPVVLLGIGLISTAAFGQALGQPAEGSSRPTMRPVELLVAPNALMSMAGPPGGGAGPVNICRELTAFLQQQHAPAADQQPVAQSLPTSQSPPTPPSAVQAGQSGSARKDNNAPAPGQDAPNVDKPQHESGITGPVPPGTNMFRLGPITLEQAREYESRNDVLACRDAVQRMRRQGMTLPEGLLALAALRPDLQQPRPNAQ